uniref:Transporter n=1 Tax=Cryptocotyle lingua TaxID=66766 RepID=A0A7U0TI61_9TREM|nr:sodium- and chloride-dependent taurine transporter [Cryptocotyle lingua]
MNLGNHQDACVYEVPQNRKGQLQLVLPKQSGEEASSKREQWQRRFDFLLACVGMSVGLGNVWRFPYLCYKNGGGAFLIPYFISVIAAGLPVFLLEVTLGQLTAQGGIAAWNICPLFRGIGFASAVTNFSLDCYYNVILAWAIHYLFSSFTAVLPWSTCGNAWNTDYCRDLNSTNQTKSQNGTVLATNETIRLTDPASEYWERYVLRISDGIENMGTIQWELALCLLAAWIIVFLCIYKGIKTSGKVMYVTATAPYVFMFILLGRAVSLEGAADGLRYYITPNWSKLSDMTIWSDAGAQIFFSYSISLGTLTAFGSYNRYHHNSVRDCIAFAIINTFTSLLAGLVIFATLGHMSTVANVSIDKVAESGPGLAFVVYPKALGLLPASPFWAVCFFIMILLLGIDSQFAGVEGLVTAITDFFPRLVLYPRYRMMFVGSICIACFFVGLPMITNGGMYLFQLFNHYAGSLIILLTAFFECIAVGYVYGARRLSNNMKAMHGYGLGYLPVAFWCVITPCFTLAVFIISVTVYEELTYERASRAEAYQYPGWAVLVGWMLASSSVVMIPIVMIIQIIRTPGSFVQRIKTLCRPVMNENLLARLENNFDATGTEEYPAEASGENRANVPVVNGFAFHPSSPSNQYQTHNSKMTDEIDDTQESKHNQSSNNS